MPNTIEIERLTVRRHVRVVTKSLFLRIAEPRHIRLLQFGVYGCMMFAGVGVLRDPPGVFEESVGIFLVYVFGIFVALGSILCAVSVLPGIWWLERAGLMALGTGVAMYVTMAISLGASILAPLLSIALVLTFIQRFTEIRGSQLAPREE